ncbi:MAG: aminotransferase class V-fold PLP-dependent enzyme, partial [Gemmatimonadota bacterium]|nr:aminotransferase class V-fold PLP-dependent enzyme [Gemmatimonadota bacterium]
HVLVNVEHLGCDFLACSAYKFYGPHIGILWGRRDLIESADVPRLEPAPQQSPERLETGTQNHEGIAGAAAAVEFLAAIAGTGIEGGRRASLRAAYAELHRRGEALLAQLWNGLEAIPGVTLYGPRPGEPRTPTIAFTKDGWTTTDVARRLANEGLFVSNGDFYAATVMERIGRQADGVVRVGASCYTTGEEIERVVSAVKAL